MQDHPELQEFGDRLVALNNGGIGLRAGLTCHVRSPVEGEPILDFIASDETVDRYNEVIELAGWQLANYRKNPVVLDSHDYYSIGRILGRSEMVGISEGKLVNRVRFATDNPLGDLAYKMARGGFIKSESVGFIPLVWDRGDESAGEPYRTFKKQELIEISLVSVPANPGATLGLALKSGAIRKHDLSELAEFLQSFCNPESFRGSGGVSPSLSSGAHRAPLHFCSDTAEPRSNSGAQGAGIDGAQPLQLERGALLRMTEQLIQPIRAVLRRA